MVAPRIEKLVGTTPVCTRFEHGSVHRAAATRAKWSGNESGGQRLVLPIKEL